MYYFIYLLKALAAMLITNAHYENIYPISIIANGGLLGDVIFFAVSGYCLYNIKDHFIKWYGKRIVRIYPTVLLCVTIYCLAGYWMCNFNLQSIISLFIYPTNYHFISSIMFLYIIYYFVITWIKKSGKNEIKCVETTMLVTAGIYMIYYVLFYDKSYYHIDSVYQFSIRFLFFICMMLGVWLKLKKDNYLSNFKKSNYVLLLVTFALYFASKLLFSKIQAISMLQIVNQGLLVIVLYFAFCSAMSLENKLQNLPKTVMNVIKFIADMTLEIYLIQYLIIERMNVKFFPVNFLIVTASILLCAFIINRFVSYIRNKMMNIYNL